VTEGAIEQGRGIGGISARAASWLAWSLWALTVILSALSLLLLVLSLRYPNSYIPNWWLGNVLEVVIDATVGAVVASRRFDNPVGWLLCLTGIAVSTSTFTSLYAVYALLGRRAR